MYEIHIKRALAIDGSAADCGRTPLGEVLSTLNEAQARWFVADKTLDLGRGAISRLSQVTGISRMTITRAMKELRGRGVLQPAARGHVRREGGGRKPIEESSPAVMTLIKAIVEETTAGEPMSLQRWTSKSTRTIAEELARRGHRVHATTVGRCLYDLGYSLQANRKTKEGPQHGARDEQFRYINRLVKTYIKGGDPVISVDTKKKELVGEFRNAGRTFRPQGKPVKVHVHDFPHLGRGKAVPYGAYDIARNRAVVNVGISHDTAEFAIESIRRWWRLDGRRLYHDADRLLINTATLDSAEPGQRERDLINAWYEIDHPVLAAAIRHHGTYLFDESWAQSFDCEAWQDGAGSVLNGSCNRALPLEHSWREHRDGKSQNPPAFAHKSR